ncbi:MAG: UDP-glucose/GDP-mannose dehydrogenase family protein [Deltaproteobacteria bacterium]|nr:UDP-glucose/GDP-mannose dehydrogenase family protein [Deltaproteobacteria bacterium]MBF0525012.1 UDP-glucose/GDP-mannose dehydrogenase family protein [Deltaproteobacteria bacterium]
MKICVLGMWHLGTVTAACLAAAGFSVIGLDSNKEIIDGLSRGKLPIKEPGLENLVVAGTTKGLLSFTDSPDDITDSDILWVAYDTPVDEEDRADVDFVVENVRSVFPFLKSQTLIIISSQLPVGSIKTLEELYHHDIPGGAASFACVPENLRLGKAISVFTHPDRVVAGVRTEKDQALISRLLRPFTDNIIWMSVESAEMTKHALNSFLAVSITFINELAVICEQVGANVGDVEKGLKSDVRIGPGAYLRAGGPFAGGTLARDINYLISFGQKNNLATPLISGVLESNNTHKHWSRRAIKRVLNELHGKKVAVLGLTYKPGTNTLRRSESLEVCRWLNDQGTLVSAYDPVIENLPDDAGFIRLCRSAQESLQGSHALLMGTEWPQFRDLKVEDIIQWMIHPVVIDPGSFLGATLGGDTRVTYLTVGRPS